MHIAPEQETKEDCYKNMAKYTIISPSLPPPPPPSRNTKHYADDQLILPAQSNDAHISVALEPIDKLISRVLMDLHECASLL